MHWHASHKHFWADNERYDQAILAVCDLVASQYDITPVTAYSRERRL